MTPLAYRIVKELTLPAKKRVIRDDARIFLDGVELADVVTADEEAGEVHVIKRDDAGNPVVDHNAHGFAIEVRRGKVQIRL